MVLSVGQGLYEGEDTVRKGLECVLKWVVGVIACGILGLTGSILR